MQRISIERFLTIIYDRQAEVLSAVAKARRLAASTPLALDARYVADPVRPPVAVSLRRISDGELEQFKLTDARSVAARVPLRMPAAYVVHSHQAEIAALLDRQGIRYQTLKSPRTVQAVELVAGREAPTSTASKSTLMDATPNPMLDEVRERRINLKARPGDLWIDVDQQRGRLAAVLLEPRSNSCLFRAPDYLPLVSAGRALPVYRIPQAVN